MSSEHASHIEPALFVAEAHRSLVSVGIPALVMPYFRTRYSRSDPGIDIRHVKFGVTPSDETPELLMVHRNVGSKASKEEKPWHIDRFVCEEGILDALYRRQYRIPLETAQERLIVDLSDRARELGINVREELKRL